MKARKICRVRNVMKENFDSVDRMATVREALQKMRHVDTKCLIVDKRDQDDEFGILLISDISRHVLAKDRSPDRVNVYEVMAKPIITVDADMDIRHCARLFSRFDLSRAPVVENGKVIGIVSFTDLVIKGFMALENADEEEDTE
jgi:CBS domain-containing protein